MTAAAARAGCSYCAATTTARLTSRRRDYATASWMSYGKNGESSKNFDDDPGPPRRFRSSPSTIPSSAYDDGIPLHEILESQRPSQNANGIQEKPQPTPAKQNRKTARIALLRRPMQVIANEPVSSSFARRRIKTIVIPIPQGRAKQPKEQRGFLQTRTTSTETESTGGDTGIGRDTLVPTSESGLPESSSNPSSTASLSQIFSPEFRAQAKTDDMIAEMDKIMSPLIQNCLEASASGNSSTRELEQMREYLQKTISIYKTLSKREKSKKSRLQEGFLKTIATSKWNDDRETWIRGIAEDQKRLRAEFEDVPASGGIYSTLALDIDTPRTIDTTLPTISGKAISISTIKPLKEVPVAKLAHGLERVLFNPGIHWLQDPKSKYYNYPQAIQNVMPKERFDFEQLPKFVPPSQDKDLKELLKASGRIFAGSTSSLTSAMSHIYFALNGKKLLNTQTPNFVDQPRTFTFSSQLPASIVLNRTPEGTYLIDADKSVGSDSGSNVLSMLGNVLEKFLTYEPKEFERFDVKSKNPFKPEESREKREAYHYSGTDSLIMRSQLDCQDDRLPRKTFDIKTRATVAIRQDLLNHVHGAGYTISRAFGFLESFEREKYDLIRAAFLKYSFQARIGKMDGIFLAYHSTERIFGFEYLPLEDIDKYISGSHEESTQAYHLCVMILEAVLKRVVADIPDQSLRLSFDSRDGALQVLSSPMGDDSASPLKLYDIQLTNYLNGIEMTSRQVIDFASVPGFFSPSSISSNTTKTHDIPSETVNEPDWTVAYDIVVNEDEAYNRKRLEKIRKKQTIFSKRVLLPEGLTEEEKDRALNPEKANKNGEAEKYKLERASAQSKEEGDNKAEDAAKTPTSGAETVQAKQDEAFASINATPITRFVPRPGVKYFLKPHPLVIRTRALARRGRARAANAFAISNSARQGPHSKTARKGSKGRKRRKKSRKVANKPKENALHE